jgi:hypothetical protein
VVIDADERCDTGLTPAIRHDPLGVPRTNVTALRAAFTIQSWPRWDDEIHARVQEFRAHHGVAPHILLASSVTFRRIDLIAKKERLVDDDGHHPDAADHTAVSSFAGTDYTLDFCLDEHLPSASLVLVHDDGGSGDGEPVPGDDGLAAAGTRRAA